MTDFFFILIGVVYVFSLSIIDSLVNRLIFRENHKLSYFSIIKQRIYKRSEWVVYCTLFLIVLPVLLPIAIAYQTGGLNYILGYIFILSVVEWDMIFGKLVFNDWFGDLPSICLPKIGWIRFKLWPTVLARLFVALSILFFFLLQNKI
ncbi:hypothetical protein HZB69_02590 [Candidatus Amesbacteria bacterium]|nr:hypothetical protein [Candidatus Amesbacteria bacterium]